jgi:hypothetical protein
MPEQKKDAKLTKAEQEAVDNVVRKAKGRNAVERIVSSSRSRKRPGYVIFGLNTATLLLVRVDLLKAHVVESGKLSHRTTWWGFISAGKGFMSVCLSPELVSLRRSVLADDGRIRFS